MASATPRQGTQVAPFPERLEPMLAVTAPAPFDSPERLFEIKWDGIRTLAFVSRGRVWLQGRNLQDITGSFPDVSESIAGAVRADGVILDGELVALGKDGVPRLPLVLQRLSGAAPPRRGPAFSLEVFDILYRDHRPLLAEPLWRRKRYLNESVRPNRGVHICHFEEGAGIAFFDAAVSLGLEGVIAKDKHSFYYPGKRSRHWLKIKRSRSANLVVGGYTFGGGNRKELFGGLLLGAYEANHLRYVGTVVGGFSAADLKTAYALLAKLHTSTCPFESPPVVQRFLYWCEPRLVVQVKYGETTADGRLRFPVFTALRPDVRATECTLASLGQG